MNLSKISLSAALMLGLGSAYAEQKMVADIAQVSNGSQVTINVNMEDNTDLAMIDCFITATEGIVLGTPAAGSDASTFVPVDAGDGEWWIMDMTQAIPNGNFLTLKATLNPGVQCGTITITPNLDLCADLSMENLIPINTLTITVVSDNYALGKNGYSTFSSANATKVTGATAYYVKVDGDVAKFTAVENNVVPANTGVVLKGTEGDVVTFAPNAEVAAGDCDLTACVSGATVEKNTVHVLATKDGQTGFYLYNGASIGAGKAYLEGSTAARIVFDEETGINDINAEQNVEAIFNLQGQKMTEAKKGINIVNGKKVMF